MTSAQFGFDNRVAHHWCSYRDILVGSMHKITQSLATRSVTKAQQWQKLAELDSGALMSREKDLFILEIAAQIAFVQVCNTVPEGLNEG